MPPKSARELALAANDAAKHPTRTASCQRDRRLDETGTMPQDMKAFNRAIIEEFRANGGRLSGPMAKSQLILL